MVSEADPLGRNLGFLDRTSLEHSHKALHRCTNKIKVNRNEKLWGRGLN
jgi:hypothetical protein